MTKAMIIRMDVKPTETGLLRATSEDYIGLHAVSRDLHSLKSIAQEMLHDLFLANGEDVSVYEAEGVDTESSIPWVIVPNSKQSAAC